MQDIALVCKNQRQKDRRKHSNNSLRERLRTHKAHMQDIALVCKNRDRKKGINTVTVHYVNVSIFIT